MSAAYWYELALSTCDRGTPDGWVGMPEDAPFRCCECDWRGVCGGLDDKGNCPACGGQTEPL